MVHSDENFDLTILPVKKDHYGINTRRPIHPILPNIHEGSLCIACSAPRTGKSSLVANLFLNSNFMKDAFSEVYYFSSTLHQDTTGRKMLEAYPATSYEDFDENKLMKILDSQKRYEDDERPSIAIVLDDLPSTLKPKSLFFTLASSYRHYGIGMLLYSIQRFSMIPPLPRQNATNLFIGMNNAFQMKQIAKEFGENYGSEQNFLKYHRLAVPQRFNFMYARLDQYPPTIHKNFETKPIFEADM
tara:strand:- start:1617 stop:2348 length:732 start_codon:yes stop_codon:yes gene_type:complete